MPSSQFSAMATAYGIIAAAQYPFTITFSRSLQTKGTAGGNLTPSPTNNTPVDIPCRYEPSSAAEREMIGRSISGVMYSIYIPNVFSSALVDVDSKSTGTIAAVSGFEPARTFSVIAPLREMAIEIVVLASIEG